jgi:hypothetical protein
MKNERSSTNDNPQRELIQVVTLPDEEDDDLEPESANGITLNLTTLKETHTDVPNSAEEADRSASSTDATAHDVRVASTKSLVSVLSREFTFNTPTMRVNRVSERCRSLIMNRQSVGRVHPHSCIPSIEEQPTTLIEEEKESSSDNASLCSIASSMKTMLSNLSSHPTAISEAPEIILQKSLAGSASPSPNPTPIITIRPCERLTSNLSPRRHMNPLHSSTPSMRNKSLQMVSIGEQEQVSTTVPQQLDMDSSSDDQQDINMVSMVDNEQQVEIPIRSKSLFLYTIVGISLVS